MKRRIITLLALLALLITAALLYGLYSPEHSALFPKCIFLRLTGLQCPGCGSQRAIHALLNIEIGKAISYNAPLVLSLPYLVVGLWCEGVLYLYKGMHNRWVTRAERIKGRYYSGLAVKIALVVVILFAILRNVI